MQHVDLSFIPLTDSEEDLDLRVIQFFLTFLSQNPLPQTMIGMFRVIFKHEKNQTVFSVEKDRFDVGV